MAARREKEREKKNWRWGYICALAALNDYGEDTIFDHLVDATGEAEALVKKARRDGAMKWSGLSGYVRRKATHD